MAEFYPLLFGRGFSLSQLLFFCCFSSPLCRAPVPAHRAGDASHRPKGGLRPPSTPASPGALRGALPLHPPAGFFSPPGSIAVRRAVNIYYQ